MNESHQFDPLHKNDQKSCFCTSVPVKHTNTCNIFTLGPLQSADRMALCTPGYSGIKQGLPSQAPHRIPNTIDPRTPGLVVTSFLERQCSFLWCISCQIYWHWAPAVSSAQIGQNLRHWCLYSHCEFLLTHLFSGQSRCRTGSWWRPGCQTSQWQNLRLCINVRQSTSLPGKRQENMSKLPTLSSDMFIGFKHESWENTRT